MSASQEALLSRITFHSDSLSGKPIIRGLRISVAMILELFERAPMQEVLEDDPELEMADIQTARLYAGSFNGGV